MKAGAEVNDQRDVIVLIEPYLGPRATLLPLFAQADDSPTEIRTYLELGEVFVACRAGEIVGHIQLIAAANGKEIKSLAVAEKQRRKGIGSALVRTAVEWAFAARAARVLVATATADIDNLRFYQRLGFRMDRIERDAFDVAHGYPASDVDGIPVRDRVWFSLHADDLNLPG